MEKQNPLELRKRNLMKTGLCNQFDFLPEKKTRFEYYTFDFDMSIEAKQLLNLAFKNYNFSDVQLERIERITKAILLLENKKDCEVYHVAEAIQYVV